MEKSQNESNPFWTIKNHERIFHMLAGGGGNQHMENSICFVIFIFESFPYEDGKRFEISQKSKPF